MKSTTAVKILYLAQATYGEHLTLHDMLMGHTQGNGSLLFSQVVDKVHITGPDGDLNWLRPYYCPPDVPEAEAKEFEDWFIEQVRQKLRRDLIVKAFFEELGELPQVKALFQKHFPAE